MVAFSTAVPLAAASQLDPACVDVTFEIEPGQTAEDSLTLSATVFGLVYTVIITSTPSTETVVGQIDNRISQSSPPNPAENGDGSYKTFNLATIGSGWNGGPQGDTDTTDHIFSNFAPAGAPVIVLNQRGEESATEFQPTQTLTMSFFKGANPFDPTNLKIDIFDLTSAELQPGDSGYWRQTYHDAVWFSSLPDAVAPSPGSVARTLAGSGTASDPYRTPAVNQPTPSDGTHFSDTFTFNDPQSIIEMTYANYGRAYDQQKRGWQFIGISGIRFTDTACVVAP